MADGRKAGSRQVADGRKAGSRQMANGREAGTLLRVGMQQT
jgi:hypothetical protein